METQTVPTSVDLLKRVPLGRTGRMVSRLGIGSSYGVGATGVEQAYAEYGTNYLYWGSLRRKSFGQGISHLAARHREDLVVAVQTYTRIAGLMAMSVNRALGKLKLDYADVLLLGLFNKPPAERLMDAARRLRDAGKVRFLGVSCHKRPTFAHYVQQGFFDVLMFRYNAAHRGAERQIFPHLTAAARPGTVSYTATRWGHLINPDLTPEGERTPCATDCYRFVLSQPCVDLCLTGPENTEQLREALEALQRGPMDEEELAWMRRVGDHVYRQPLGRSLRSRLWRIGGAN